MHRLPALNVFLFALLFFSMLHTTAQTPGSYTPSPANEAARRDFQDAKFGLFIHWGASSVLGAGEWVMNQRGIRVNEYRRLQQFFNPTSFSASEWVGAAKAAGMKYITFITRHHDGFSNWDTKESQWKITNTPYGQDVLKALADECQKQNIKLVLYYSLVDWFREDYPHQTGRTGQASGRSGTGDYAHYLQFMKAQLTELLTNYGPIAGIWFDGHWDQTAPEGAADRTSRLDWKYDEIYGLIHRLQPQCMIGNNHHMTPFPGEDFQMFERDLPGENKSGLSFQKAASHLPLETCETMNNSWGFNITDTSYKTVPQLIRYLVNAAGRNANFLLNVGPMPNGAIQQEFRDSLAAVGAWLKQNGESIYGTRGGVLAPQPWGVVTAKGKTLYVHVLNGSAQPYIFLPELKAKVMNASSMANGKAVKFKQQAEGVFIYPDGIDTDAVDTIIKIETK